ncbi:spore germination protein [Clostridium rectalis]|uniref:spore germination protein n=1 Tax=Clostridium rectalis TaxID=2040295 RepID=UPI000F62C906|nr:spore germination protein [Clostridium rectalis]
MSISFHNEIKNKVYSIKEAVGDRVQVSSRNIYIKNKKATIIYIKGLINKNILDRDVLNPLMLKVKENLNDTENLEEYICSKYIPSSDVYLEIDLNSVAEEVKKGHTAIIIEGCEKVILIDTSGGKYRDITDPINESSVKGSREGFVDNIETNMSIIRRRIKDKNLVMEKFVVGRRSQTDVVMIYIDDIVSLELLNNLRDKINNIDVDSIIASGMLDQFMERHTFSLFPQSYSTERPDLVQANLMEGRIAILVNGSPFAITIPALFFEFFHTVEDYSERTLLGSVIRFIRYIAMFIVISLPAVYLTFIKFNPELIPLDFIESLIQSRQGIALTPFMSLLGMNLIVEFLREGGLRLPIKIGQTLSVVGGIIIGDAAIRSKLVSASTLVVVGVTTVSTFLIPNYEMALSMRLLSFIMTVLGNFLGMLGVASGWFIIIGYLSSLDSYGVPYFNFKAKDLKDILVRAPLWTMDKRPEAIPNRNPIRQKEIKNQNRRKNNG